jgi:hypothetical protein
MRYKLIELKDVWVIQDLETFRIVSMYNSLEEAEESLAYLNAPKKAGNA